MSAEYDIVEESTEDPGPHWTQTFFFQIGGSVLYLLSGLCIVYGLIQTMAPALQETDSVLENLKCLVVLHSYELALLGVALLIVLWRRVEDDAVSLAVLITIFFVVSGISLDTIGHDRTHGPGAALSVGLGSLLLSVGKLLVLRRYILRGIGVSLIAVLAGFLIWNFGSPAVMTILRHWYYIDDEAMRMPWQAGWGMILLAAAGLLACLISAKPVYARRRKQPKPFLRTPGMGWVMGVILLVACSVHQYSQAHIFDIPKMGSDWLPAFCLLVMMLLQLRRLYSSRVHSVEYILIFSAAVMGMLLTDIDKCPATLMEWMFYPPLVLLASGGVTAWLAIRQKRFQLLHALSMYPVVIALPFGYAVAAVSLCLMVIVYAWRYSSPYIAMLSTWLFAIAFPQNWFFGPYITELMISRVAAGILMAAVSTVVIEAVLGRRGSDNILCLGSMLLSIGVISCFVPVQSALHAPAISSILCTLLIVTAAWRRGSTVPVLPGYIPVVYTFYCCFQIATGWAFMMLSFVLLGAGAIISLRKNRHLPPAEEG